MGKGNRSRIERAMAESANTDKNVKAKKNKVSGAGIFVAIAAILVVIALLVGCVSLINEGGVFARATTVVQTEDGEYRVTGTMMNYFFMTIFNQNYQQVYQMCQSYGLISSTTSQNQAAAYVYSMMGIDPNMSLKSQYADKEKTTTVFDHYMSQTETYVARMLTACELATKYDLKLDDKDLEDIEASIESMEQNYEYGKLMAQIQQMQGVAVSYPSSFAKYLTQTYGTGVNENDVRECLKLMILASKFEEKLYDEKEEFVANEEDHKIIEEYVENNPASFLMADYTLYSFTIKSKNYKNDADFEAAKAEILEKAKKLAAAEGKEGYKAAVMELLKETEKEAFQAKNWDKYLKEADGDETAAQTKLDEAFEKQWETLKVVKYSALQKTGYKYPSKATDLSKWIFGYDAGEHTEDCTHEGEHEESCEAAKEGDIKYFETTTTTQETVKDTTTAGTTASTETTTEESTTEGAAPAAETTTAQGTTAGSASSANKIDVTTYTVSVYLLDKEAYRDTEITKHIGYVSFEKKEDAEKFLEAFSKLETKDKEAMMDLVDEMYEEIPAYNYGAYENYKAGDLEKENVKGLDEWLKEAKKGDVSGIIELKETKTTTSSSSSSSSKEPKTYYAVAVFDGDGYEYWFQQAMTGAAAEQVSKWYEENTLELTFNQGVYIFFNPKP